MADQMRPTPRSPILGLFSDIVNLPLQYMSSPERTQQMQGTAQFLYGTGIPKTLERMSYGDSLFSGAGGLGGTTRMRPETAEALMNVAPFAPAAGRLAGRAIRATEGMPVGMSIKDVGNKFNIIKNDASDIFGSGSQRIRYIEPNSGGSIEVLSKPDGSASVLSLEVPEKFRGKKIGESLQSQVMQDFPNLQGQVSSKAAAKTAYRLGRRPVNQPNASLEDIFKIIDEDSSVNLISPNMQKNFFQFTYPQQAALDLAQQRAALPVSEGGLGLPANNTPMDRAKAMGAKDMVHFSRSGGDYTILDSGQYAVAPFDAIGTHVGTPQSAMERFQNTVGYKVNNPNYANDELKGATYPVTILGDRPLMNQNGMPWGEDDLNAFLRKEGGHNWSDVNGGKMTYQDMNAKLRKKLFEEQGYTSIPYFNEVEGKGSISYIVPPENIRSRFAAFDPFRKDVATATAMGVALPDLLAQPVNQYQQTYETTPMYTDPFGNTIGSSIR